jgi:hypothetical protein
MRLFSKARIVRIVASACAPGDVHQGWEGETLKDRLTEKKLLETVTERECSTGDLPDYVDQAAVSCLCCCTQAVL